MEKFKAHDLIADPTHIRYEILAMLCLLDLWDLYLNIRQRKLMKNLSSMPKSLDLLMTEETYQKARLYALDKNAFSNLHKFYSIVIKMISIFYFAMFHCWEWSIILMEKLGTDTSNEFVATAGFIFISTTVLTIINFPFEIYEIFVLEEKHGFNKQTALFFIRDQVLKYFVSQLMMLPLVCGCVWIVKNGGDYFFVYVWMFLVAMTIFMLIIYPKVIAPLFDKYSPLPEGELKQKIEALASSLNFPLYKLYIVEGSKRSSHSNAYFYGFFKHKRIVLFDTLVKEYYPNKNNENNEERGCDVNEVLAVLVHELGHWQYNHTWKGFALVQALLLLNFFLFAKLLNYGPVYEAFGFSANNQPIIIGLIIIMNYILTPINTLFNFFMMAMSRRFEFQADAFGKKLGHGPALKRGLIKLQKDNLSYPLYDKLYSSWYHNHPPLLERLEALDKVD